MRQWLYRVGVAVLAMSALGWQAPTPRPVAPRSLPVLDGTVKAPDGTPASGALVLAQPSAAFRATPLVTRTDDTGAFHLALESAAPQDVYVEAPRLAPVTRERVPAGRLLTIVLEKGATLEGTVREGGKPVAGARVEARNELLGFRLPWSIEAGVARAETDATGHFAISGLAHSRYTVTARATGRGFVEQRQVPLGRPLALVLQPGSSIVGSVVGPDRVAIAGASVRAESEPRFQPQAAARTTDARGRFELDGIQPGAYRLVVLHRDWAPGLASGIVVEPRRDTTAHVTLGAGATLRGRLLVEGDRPARGRVRIQALEGQPASAILEQVLVADSAVDGRFLMPRVPAGSLVFAVTADGYGAKSVPVAVGSKTVDADAGDITLQVGLAIRGRVRIRDGAGVTGASILGYARGSQVEGRSQVDGSFILAGLQPGPYRLMVRAAGHGSLNKEIAAGSDGVELVLDSAGSIGGRVVDEAGRPVDVFRVAAQRKAADPWENDGDNAGDFTAADGRFALADVGPGEWVVAVEAPEKEARTVSGVKVVAGVETDVGVVRLGAGTALRGVVVDSNGAAVVGASVTARLPREFQRSLSDDVTVSSDEAGAFELRGLRPGSYDVWAQHPAHAAGAVRGLSVDAAKGLAEARIVLAQGGRIEGTARTRGGNPIASCYVQVEPPDDTLRSVELRGAVGDGGSFTIEHVPTGAVRVRLMLGDGGSRYTGTQTRQVEIGEGGVTRVDFVQRDILVAGHATRASGPVVGLRVSFMGETGMYMSGGPGPAVASGIRRLEGVTREDGSYELLLDGPGTYRTTLRSADNKLAYPSRTVEVPEVENFSFDIVLPGVPVSGLLVDETSQEPLEGSVTAGPSSGGYSGRATAGPDGRFQLDLESGDHVLSGLAKEHVSASVSLTVGESGVSDVRLALPRGSLLSGRVIDSRGIGVPTVEVSALAAHGSTSGGDALTQSDGSFRMQQLRPMAYNLLAGSGGLGFALRTATPGDEEVVLTLRPGGRIALRVVGPSGAPLAGIWPEVETVRGLRVWLSLNGGTRSAGTLEFAAPSGRVTGTVGQGTLVAPFQAEVREGVTTSVEVKLQETAPRE